MFYVYILIGVDAKGNTCSVCQMCLRMCIRTVRVYMAALHVISGCGIFLYVTHIWRYLLASMKKG